MGRIIERSTLAKIAKSQKPLSMLGSKGYFDPANILGSYPRPFYAEAGSIIVVNCFDDNIIDSILLDLAGNQNGTITGTILSSESKFRESLLFNGSSDYIDFSNPAIFDLTSQITLEVWIKFISTGSARSLMAKGTAWKLQVSAGDGFEFVINNYTLSSGVALNTIEWFYIVGTYDGSTMRIYINGEEKNNTAKTGAINTNADNVYIGRDSGGNYADVYTAGGRISNRAKTANEIHDYYQGLMGL